tara:strand:- start:23 stop:433 length:411 start_codon:yes stop_codon:yes gene_type:complete
MADENRKNWRRRLRAPETAIKGEIITIKTMAEHIMEPGVRRDPDTGVIYPKKIIDHVYVRYNGKQVFKSQWYSGVSANPFMAFKLKVESTGLLEIEWVDDYGQSTFKRAVIDVYNDKGELIYPFEVDKPGKNKEVI